MRPAIPPPKGPWLSWKDWRRGMRVAIERRLPANERRALLARLARVRHGLASAAPPLRVIKGGATTARAFVAPHLRGPREAA